MTHSQEKDSHRNQSQSYPNVGITRKELKATILNIFEDLKEDMVIIKEENFRTEMGTIL